MKTSLCKLHYYQLSNHISNRCMENEGLTKKDCQQTIEDEGDSFSIGEYMKGLLDEDEEEIKEAIFMTRSIRKKYFLGNACRQSERKDKQNWHRAFRRKEKQKLFNNVGENYISTLVKEASNPWGIGKDGKKYHSAGYLLALIKKISKKYYKNQNKRELIERERKMFYRWVGK